MAKTYQDIQNELGVNEGNSIVELIAKMNDYNVVSPSEITKIISVSVDRLENQVTGKAKEVKRRMYEPVTDDTKGIVSVLNKRIVLLDMIINKLKLEALDILNQHRTNYSNPHKVTKTQVGLNNVDNTSDLDKPISKATQTALNEISSDLDTHKNNTSNPHNVTKAQVGLSSVLDKEQLGKQEKAVDSDKLNGQKADYYAVKENVENEAAYDLDFSMDSSNYVLTVYLKNKSGVVLTQKSIDLPLETMVIGGRYDNETKKIILTLRGVDVPVEFSVADLISGLQGEINENNKLRVELIDGLTKAYLGLEKVINKGMDDKPTANSDNYVKSGGVYSELNKKIDKSQGSSNANKVFMTDSSGNLILTNTIPSSSLPATGVSVDTAKQLEKTDGTKIGADEVALKKDFNNVDNTSDMDKPISTATQQALDLKADKKDVSEVDIDLEGTGTIVSIPENATGYGTIEKLGGKSEVVDNTLNIKYPTNVKVVGANLFDIYNLNVLEINWCTAVINNGSLNLTCRGSWNEYILSINTTIGKTYTLNCKYINANANRIRIQIFDINDNEIKRGNITNATSGDYNLTFTATTNIIKLQFHPNYTEEANNNVVVFKNIMLNEGSTALPYTPYTEQLLPQTNAINYVSNELQTKHSWSSEFASKWLGLGVGNDSNIINYANKKAIVKYSIIDMSSLNWYYTNNTNVYHSPSLNTLIKKATYDGSLTEIIILCPNVKTTFADDVFLGNIGIAVSVEGIIYYKDTNTSQTETPTGLLIYELATPIEIDLSSLETEEHFECEPNGSIIHDNIANYKYSFPVSLKGQVELNFEHDKEQQRDIDSLKKEIDELDNNKVDKEDGKGLSTNDFTNELKSKLDNLSNYDDTIIKNEIASIKERLDWIEKYFVAEGSIIVSGTATELDSDGKYYYYSGSFTVDGTVKSAQIISTNAARFDITYSENIINYKLYASSVRELSANIEYTFVKQGL